jgi:hypothetical protein
MESETFESTREKKNTGYTYWKREIADSHLLPSSEPRRIEHSSSEESLKATSSGQSLVSRWNSGTTYEEKNVTDRAYRILADILSQLPMIEDYEFDIKSPSKCFKGEVHAHAVRGKPRIGYEFESITLTMSSDSTDNIDVEILDVDSTDPDGFSIKFSSSSFLHSQTVKQHLKKHITDAMSEMVNRLLQSSE